jgi:multicomponent Na+:H+ antiporter subunit C
MTFLFAAALAVMFAAGLYAMLQRDLARVAVGALVVSNAANLLLIASGLQRGRAPIHPVAPAEASDPLVQALALTAIVISFGVFALLLGLVHQTYRSFESLDEHEVAALERREEAG